MPAEKLKVTMEKDVRVAEKLELYVYFEQLGKSGAPIGAGLCMPLDPFGV